MNKEEKYNKFIEFSFNAINSCLGILGWYILAYIKSSAYKIFGLLSLIMTLLISGTFGFDLIYPIVLFTIGYLKVKN